MNNRDWLYTLSDEEFANEWLKIEKMLHGDCGFHIEVIMQYLQAPHTTTADEDFAEIGFTPDDTWGQKGFIVAYKDNKDRVVLVTHDCNKFLTEDKDFCFNDTLIDQIRTIADKKRKEMNW